MKHSRGKGNQIFNVKRCKPSSGATNCTTLCIDLKFGLENASHCDKLPFDGNFLIYQIETRMTVLNASILYTAIVGVLLLDFKAELSSIKICLPGNVANKRETLN